MEEKKKSKTIENKNLIKSILYLKQNNLMKETESSVKFETSKEAETSKEEEILSIIKEKINSIKQDISYLQKKGHDLKLDGIKLLEIPLKTKIWSSTYSKKDLETIFKLLTEVETRIAPIKKQQEQVDIEKEKEEVEKEKAEKALSEQKQIQEKPIKQNTTPVRGKTINPKK